MVSDFETVDEEYFGREEYCDLHHVLIILTKKPRINYY